MLTPELSPDDAQNRVEAIIAEYRDKLANANPLVATDVRGFLAEANTQLAQCFRNGTAVQTLVAAHATLIDQALLALWQSFGVDHNQLALVAVGGYGRGELHPGSDIDIMLLLSAADVDTSAASEFVTALWDTGLEIGHSVRTVEDCVREARDDLTVATTLMEARLLSGPQTLFDEMCINTGPDKIWPSSAFFSAKLEEQQARHSRYDDTGYNLEPNVKGSPGGLRDIQLVGWVAKRHFGVRSFDDLVRHRFLSHGQAEKLIEDQRFLWTVRYGLHILTGRREDRLLFDHQKNLALMLGYEDARYTLGVEQMMQRYYRTVMELSRLNEMLLQLFEEAILLSPDNAPITINNNFVIRNGYLQTTGDDVFARDPSTLLELFIHMQETPGIKGVSAWTIGLLRRHRHLIDEQFRQHPGNHRLFLQLLDAKEGVTHELRRMNRYGILGLYIPAFGRIVGRMQYDLFHAYTVDEHTLFVVSYLRRFALPRFDQDDPHPSKVMQSLEQPVLAYLSGLFHDIAKGRGGDHSELGEVDALAFCREHGLAEEDAALVAWLVRHHLVLSMTAQKKDISDPDVISRFANLVGSQKRLDHLYVLTAADVRATNPKMWNSWKAKLFHDLYEATSYALRRGLENPVEKHAVISQSRDAAASLLEAQGHNAALTQIWPVLPDEYFMRHAPEEIVWHSEVLLRKGLEAAQVDVVMRPELNSIAIMFYTPNVKHTFANATAILDELGLSVLDARIEPTENKFSLDTYIVVESEGQDITQSRVDEVQRRLQAITNADDLIKPRVNRKLTRRARMFSTKTNIDLRADAAADRTVLELTCTDRPGLLLDVGKAFMACGVYINAAKIVTIGERAEDVFYLTNEQEQALDDEHCTRLHAKLSELLSNAA